MLTDKQLKEFVDWYKSVYWDTSPETWTWELPHIKAEEEEQHINMWKNKLVEIMWQKNAKQPYIHKGWRADTRLGKVFSELRLYCWPVVDWKVFN